MNGGVTMCLDTYYDINSVRQHNNTTTRAFSRGNNNGNTPASLANITSQPKELDGNWTCF